MAINLDKTWVDLFMKKGGGGVNWNILKMNSHQCFLIVEFHTINSYCSQFDPEKILPVYFCYM